MSASTVHVAKQRRSGFPAGRRSCRRSPISAPQVIVTNPMERVKVLQQLLGKSGGSVADIVGKIGISGLYQVRGQGGRDGGTGLREMKWTRGLGQGQRLGDSDRE